MPTTLSRVELHAIEQLREQELEEARVIQSVMLPSQPLRTSRVTISHEFQPIAEVGGDYLDYFLLSDESIGLYIGDVSGKGLPAALYAALTVGTLRGVHKTGCEPNRVLSVLNERLLLRGIPERHTAIQYALFDPRQARMRIVSAGMPGPFLLRGNECHSMQLAGIPPGLFPSVRYDEFTIQLEPGDAMLFCTDGITDARNIYDKEFDLHGVQEVCRENQEASAIELLGKLFLAIQSYTSGCRQWDDMTAAVFQLTS
jgi:phosphoserine phosphatase RsbU/P